MNKNVRDSLERIIVASCVKNDTFFLEIRDKDIEPKDFKSNLCRNVFEIMCTFFDKNSTIPTQSIIYQEFLTYVYDNVKDEGKAEQCKKLYASLLEMNETDEEAFAIHTENFIAYKYRDSIIGILDNAKNMAQNDDDITGVLDYVLDAYVTSFDTKKSKGGINFYDLMRKDLDAYNPLSDTKMEDAPTAKTGIYYMDSNYFNGGILEGNMCIVAGRPGSGKTTLAKCIGVNNARDGKSTLFVSLEMSKEQIAQGYYAQLARVPLGKIIKNELTSDEYNRMLMAVEKEENKLPNYHIEEFDSLTISQLINLLIKYKKQKGIEVIILDYIQQVRLPDGSVPKNEQEYSLVSELLRTVIKKLKLHAFICAQVNRECEKRPDKHPVASDLRSSGKLEQDAAYIITTYRDEIYNKETEHPKTMDITIAKNRFGPMGRVRCKFEGEFQDIKNMSDGDLGE